TCTPVAELYSQPDTGIASSSVYNSTCTASAARRCHSGIATGGGAGKTPRQPSRAQVRRNTVMPIHLCQAYHCSFRGIIGSGTIDNPSATLATISTAVNQCSAIAAPLYRPPVASTAI